MAKKQESILPALLNAINPYHWITWLRNRAFDYGIIKSRKFNIPTICIGNISVGGTGKTPHTEYLINLLQKNYNVAVLSRGYGRKSKGYRMATANDNASTIGDEPLQIKKKFKGTAVAVCEKRTVGIERLTAERKETDVILLDDAFQHRYVQAGLNILLTDFNRPVWDDALMPFGRLRESVAGIERADVIIVTKCPRELSDEEQATIKKRMGAPEKTKIFFSAMRYGTPYPLSEENRNTFTNRNDNILLLTGIAKPAPLKAELQKRGADVTLMQYPDHHNFSKKELDDVAAAFDNMRSDNKIIITTEKDAARLTGHPCLPECIKKNTFVLPIEVCILNNEKEMFNQIIFDYVTENSRNSRISQG